MALPSNRSDDDEPKGDEGVEHQLSIMHQANNTGQVKGFIAVVLLKNDELSFHIGGEFGTLSNQLGMLEQAKEAVKLYAQHRRALVEQQQKKPLNWGPGGNA